MKRADLNGIGEESTGSAEGRFSMIDLSRGYVPILLVIMAMATAWKFGTWYQDLKTERSAVVKTLLEHGRKLDAIESKLDGMLTSARSPRARHRS
jgi:hypothetical protein